MRKFLLLFLLLAAHMAGLLAQDVSGDWHGALDINGMKLRLVFHIERDGEGYIASMDSPDQGAKGIPMGKVIVADGTVKLEAPAIGARYEAKLIADSLLDGVFSQGGGRFPLRLTKGGQTAVVAKPQEPKPPFPYRTEEVRFSNDAAGISLAGTLTMPESGAPHAAVILVTGSGPQNRDGELFGHKPFWVIADHLTRHGIAVLRYDDRGVGASSGNFATATSADFASDAAAAFKFLKGNPGIDPGRIGLLGHSEGGMIAPMVAAVHEDVAFLVLLAAPGVPIDSLLLTQNRMLGKASGLSEDRLDANANINRRIYDLLREEPEGLEEQLRALLSPVFGAQASAALDQEMTRLTSPWMRYFIKHDPARCLRRVKCPVLALNGGNDLQVSPQENLSGIASALGSSGNATVTTKELPGLNHLFQQSRTGLPSEYGLITETISPVVLNEIREWIAGSVGI